MPYSLHSPAVTKKIESLCSLGCEQVNDILKRCAVNLELEELSGFTDKEKRQIRLALTDIMSVYTDKNDNTE